MITEPCHGLPLSAMTRNVPHMTTSQGSALLTIPEAAAELRVSKRTVYRYISDGTIPTVNIGREKRSRSRIAREALDAFIRKSASAA